MLSNLPPYRRRPGEGARGRAPVFSPPESGRRGRGWEPAIRAHAPRPSGFEHITLASRVVSFPLVHVSRFPPPRAGAARGASVVASVPPRGARGNATSLSSPFPSSSPPSRVRVVRHPGHSPRRSVPPPEPSYDAGERRVRFLADGFEIFVKRAKPLEHRRHRREPPLRERAHDVRAKRRLALDEKRGE